MSIAEDGTPFRIVSDMEDSIRTAERVADALSFLITSEELEDDLGAVLFLLHDALSRAVKDLDDRHERLFHDLHPGRAKDGEVWPDDKPADEEREPRP